MVKHPLHKEVGKRISRSFGSNVLRDPACSGSHRLPLFCNETKSRETEFCNVDILILKDDKVKVIVEIEESDIKPTQVCGKFLTSALSQYYIYDSIRYSFDDSVKFIHILDKSKLKARTRKLKQFEYLEVAINNILPLKNNNQIAYRIFAMSTNDFKEPMKKIIDTIDGFML